jgi:hypothetical protein
MSEPRHPSEKCELETVVSWRMIGAGAALAAASLVAVVAILVLVPPRGARGPAPEQALAPRPAAPAQERAAARPAPRKSAPALPQPTPAPAPVVAANPEPLPPPREVVASPPPAPVVVAPPAPVRKEAPVVAAATFKRIRPYGEAELFYLLDKQAKEVDLDAKDGTCKAILEEAAKKPAPQPNRADKDAAYPLPQVQPVLDVIAKRDDLKGLPVRMGDECVSGGKAAETMTRISRDFRRATAKLRLRSRESESYSAASMRDEEMLRLLSSQKERCDEAGVPALVQMLQAENLPVRMKLVAMLASVKGEKASAALASRAVFDLSPEVREAAVKALRDRPSAEYRQTLLDGLRYPWATAAEHAAEALVALQDTESIFALAELLDAPDPAAPIRDKADKWVVTEVVRVNHLRNCLLCHAPSNSKTEPIRGLVPEKGKEIPVEYYDSRQGTFVRADVVYLKQDFSLLQPVSGAAPWPAVQRFDYLTRRRELTEKEVASLGAVKDGALGVGPAQKQSVPALYPQRQAVLWALRELTGEEAGDRTEDWYRALARGYFGIEW